MQISPLNAVLDAAVDAVIVINHTGQIRMVNSATERLFGWDATELLGRDVCMLMPEPDRSAHAGYIARFLATGLPRVIGTGRDVQAQRRDGSCFPARLSVGHVAGSEPPEFIGFIHDLSERHREAEDALRLNRRLMQVTRMATMGEMSAGIAHEVNQPLTAISNYALAAERLLAFDEPEIEEARGALREIAAEARRAADIIRKLRHITRGGDEGAEPTMVDELLEELQTLCLADARAHDTRIRFAVQPDVPSLLIRRVQITQAVLNLVRNALEALAHDPPGTREVVVTARRGGAGDCEIEVSDNGPGVAPAISDRMFEPFRSTKTNGTGLGLPMSQTIAQAHGGSLRHLPGVPRGARFVLSLPAAETA
ncbi:MAG TPA: PAS domain S-box protein [Steroidobacteraceae bacterium]|nr:PAS domain S-box protein [Steroidobacteraceae bacterium]